MPPTCQGGRRRRLAAIALAAYWLGSCGSTAGLPEAPSGFTFVGGHAIGNAAACGSTEGAGAGAGSCHNLDPPNQLANTRCGPGADKCMEAAHAACEANDACVAFALRSMGNPDPSKVALYQMWDVGLANAVPNKDWELYARPKLCGTCPAGSVKVQAPPAADTSTELRPTEQYQCADRGNGMRKQDNAVVYCNVRATIAPAALHWAPRPLSASSR
jgi:hypothetical protein